MKVDPNNPIYLLVNCHIFLRNLAIFLNLIFLFVYWKRIKQISKIVLGCRSLPDCAMSTSPIGAGPTWSADKLHPDTTAAPTSSASKEAARAHPTAARLARRARAPTPLRPCANTTPTGRFAVNAYKKATCATCPPPLHPR
jgi:hypothetical protein